MNLFRISVIEFWSAVFQILIPVKLLWLNITFRGTPTRGRVLGRKHEIQVLKCDVSFIDLEYGYKFIEKKVLLLIILILTEIHNKI
jgi:hypothetical protein